MNQPNYLDYCTDEIEQLFGKYQDSVIQEIVKRIIKYGEITQSSIDQINILQESGLLYDDILSTLSEYSAISEATVIQLFNNVCSQCITYDREIYKRAGTNTAVKVSPAVEQIVNAAIKKTNGNLANLTMTTAEAGQQKFIDACSIAEMEIATGAVDVNTAIRRAVEYAIQDGVSVNYFDEDSQTVTATRNVVSAVRTAVLTGLSQTTGEVSLQNAKEMGTDVMELSAHLGARPSHSIWQGKLVCISNRNTKYLTLDDIRYGEADGFKGINCRHYWFPFLEGISQRTYTDQELEEMATATVFYNGNEIPIYKANQRQRAMERKIRAERSELVGLNSSVELAKKSGNTELAEDLQISFDNLSMKLKGHEAVYKDFCKQTGLPELSERLQYPGFNRSLSQKAVQGAKRYYLSNETPNQSKLYKLEPIRHTKEELDLLQQYANEKGVKIHEIKTFTGDIELLKEQIDTISYIKNQFGYDKNVTIMFKDMPTSDFGTTSKKGTISLNNRMLRNKKLTNLVLNEDNYLAATDIKGISAHEMGHVLQQKFGNIGIEIARKVYYNINKEQLRNEYLIENISEYSCELIENDIYQELIPEILSKHITNPNDFTNKFIALLIEGWSK